MTLPETWDREKAKWLFKKQDRPIRAEDEVVTCFRDGQVTLRSNRRTEGFTNAIQEHGYQGIRKGDFVIHAMDAFAGAIGVSDSDEKSSPVYSACTPRSNAAVNVHFYAYFMRDLALSGYLVSLAKGIKERSTDFRFKDFAALLMPVPSKDEQKAIATFLNRKTAQIDQAVAIKKKQIALLKERKQILIQNAVTRGLNPDAPMRDSGVELIGEIPAHWVIAKVGVLLKRLEQGDSPNATNEPGNFYVVKLSAIKSGRFVTEERKPISVNAFQEKYRIRRNDFLLTRGNTPELVDDSCLVEDAVENNVMFSDLVYRLSFDETRIRSKFSLYAFQSTYFRTQIVQSARGSSGTMIKVAQEHIRSWVIVFPSDEEQKTIVTHIETETTKIDKAIVLQQKQIDRLKEYKATLINSAVSGKIRVLELVEGKVPAMTDPSQETSVSA
jgi:type I restriction enzyme S subunit